MANLNTRIKQKRDTAANWEKVKDTFSPLDGEIIIVDTAAGDSRLKVGRYDSSKGRLLKYSELPFLDEKLYDSTNKKIGNLYSEIDGKAPKTHTHTKSEVGLGNVDNTADANKSVKSAAKLTTGRTINVSGAATGSGVSFDGSQNVAIPIGNVYEKYLTWGGRSISGDIAPVDAAMSYLHSANRAQFANPAGIKVEYSQDGGSTWLDYGATDAQKVNFVSGLTQNFYLGKVNSGTVTANNQLRITVNAAACNLYTNLKTVLIELSTAGSTTLSCKVEKAQRGSETNFASTVGTYTVSGWSGWNSLGLNIGAFGGGTSQTTNTGALRFTFSFNGTPAANAYANVSTMIFLGTTYWQTPSNMARTGHIYSWDYLQNTIFPASVKATSFIGSLTGNADTATNATKVNNHTVNSDVPANAKFTDTTYLDATNSASGLMSAADKTSLTNVVKLVGDKSVSEQISAGIANKVDKVSGKGLSTNDYTTDDKNKLAGIASGANKTTVDSALSSTSTNPVQNKVINTAISNLNTLVGDTAVATQISNAVSSKADISAGVYTATAISTDGIAYTVTVPGITQLTTGASFIMIPGITSNSTTPTININNLGEKPIRRKLSNIYVSVQNGYANNWLYAGVPFRLIYDGRAKVGSVTGCWIVEGCNKPSASDLSGSVSDAKNATNDGAGQEIAATYIKGLSVNDSNITYTLGNGNTGTVSLSTLIQSLLPKVTTVTLSADAWIGSSAPYYQNITSSHVTQDCKVDIQPTAEQFAEWQNDGFTFNTLSFDGSFRVYVSDTKPTKDYSIQITIQKTVTV